MNIRKIFIASAVIATALVSCRKEAPVEKLSTDKTVVTAVAEGGRLAVEVYASGAWTAEFAEDTDWVSLEGAAGDGDGEIVLVFAPNDNLYRFTKLILSLSADCAADWVGALSVAENDVIFTLSANPDEARRTAEIWFVCTDAQGKTYRTRCTITQEAKGDRTGFEGETGNDNYTVDGDKYKW